MEQRQFFVRDILTVIFKHKKLLITFPILVLLIVGALSYIWPPTYESGAKVRIMRGREVVQADPTVNQENAGVALVQLGAEEINSEIQLLHSTNLLRKVVETQFPYPAFPLPAELLEGVGTTDGAMTEAELDQMLETGEAPGDTEEELPPGTQLVALYEHEQFPYGEGVLQAPFEAARVVFRNILYILQLRERPTPQQLAMEYLDDRLITEYVRDSHVINVSLRLGDQELAQRVLNEVLQEYIAQHIDLYSNRRTNPFFQAQKNRIETELRQSQNELQEYQKNNNISLLDVEKELLLEEYTNSQRILTQLRQTKTVVGTKIEEDDFDAAVISTLSGETDSTVLREMQLRLLELILEYNRVIQSLGERHPTVSSLAEQIRAQQSNLIEAINNTEETEVERSATIQERLNILNDTRARLQQLEQDVEILAEKYDYYSQKVEESRVSDQLSEQQFSNVRVASSPTMPVDPVFPNKPMNLILALIGGIIAALALAFFLDYLDHGLKTPEDVEYYTKLQPLASFFNSGGQPIRGADAERLAILLDTFKRAGESHVLQVTSSVPNEGANNVANALADAFANDPEARTLLIDFVGDIPRARNVRHGLSDVLLEQASFDEVFPGNEALTVIGRGSHGEYPTYLWGSDRMSGIVDKLRGRYKHIVLNTAPILSSHDPVKLARFSDGVLLVIKADTTRREVVTRALTMLGDSRPKVIGAVLTERRQEIPQAVYRRI